MCIFQEAAVAFLPALCPDGSTGEQQGVASHSTPVLHKSQEILVRVNRLLCAFPLIWQCSVNEENLFNLQWILIKKKTLRKCSLASGVGLRRRVEKSKMNNVYLPLSCILSASLESWSEVFFCFWSLPLVWQRLHRASTDPGGGHSKPPDGLNDHLLRRGVLTDHDGRLCWSALKTLSTWSGKSGGKQSHVSVGRISVHGDKIKQPCEKVLRKDDAELPSLPTLSPGSSYSSSQHTGTLNEHICPRSSDPQTNRSDYNSIVKKLSGWQQKGKKFKFQFIFIIMKNPGSWSKYASYFLFK